MRFGGEVPKNLTLLQLLKTLEGAGINFEVEANKTLRVKPWVNNIINPNTSAYDLKNVGRSQ